MYRVLIVEPDREKRERLAALVDWAAFGVIEVKTAQGFDEALALAPELQPHMAFIDLQLGAHKGWTLLDEFHRQGLKPLGCMLSQEDSPNLLRQSMRCGARDFLLHPLVRQEVEAFLIRCRDGALRQLPPGLVLLPGQIDPVLQIPYEGLSEISRRVILAVRRDFAGKVSLTSVAQELGMNSKYIGRMFLEDTGLKFTDYLTAYRMLEAKKRLQGTSLRIAAIAQAVGYPHFTAFHRHFRSYFGISPSEMRKDP